jgi:polyribonucleotide nucleotidyltransferase
MYKLFTKSIPLGDGRTIEIETGKLAKQADGSVIVKMGKTMLLATVVSAKDKDVKPDCDFMPLSVEYKEKYAATGRFPGGFLKREGRPSDAEILVCRLVDRAIRPLFPEDFHADTFVTINLISAEEGVLPDALAGLAASAALCLSDVPFNGPISEVRVSRVNGKFIVNPTAKQVLESDIEIVVGATYDNVMMVEGEMKEVAETDMLEAIRVAHEAIKLQCTAQIELMKEVGKEVKRTYCHEVNDFELKNKIIAYCAPKLYEIAKSQIGSKEARGDAFASVKAEYIASLGEESGADAKLIDRYFHDAEKKAVRDFVLDTQIRIDGRKTDEIRNIWCEVDYLPMAHGSAIFTRGETQSLTTVTLGTKLDEKIIDEVTMKGRDRFLLHYNFPPFSTGDARASRGVGRREIGHGNLALRALRPMMPEPKDNPYVVRIVSDILESNGSSSMATVCAGTLALLDAGVKLKKPVAGIAMGMISDLAAGKYAILSDILGEEDHLGDMDFKVTGTADGITACQMDIKIDGLPYELLEKALEQAKQGRLHILGKLNETISAPREDMKDHTPRIEKITIDKEFIGAIIGPGGKIIQDIQERTATTITIEEVNGKGEVEICAPNGEAIKAALSIIKSIVTKPEVGEIYEGKVKSVVAFGAFVEILPGIDALLHISEIEWKRLETVEEALKVGDAVTVKLIGEEKGKYKLSRKILLPKPDKN